MLLDPLGSPRSFTTFARFLHLQRELERLSGPASTRPPAPEVLAIFAREGALLLRLALPGCAAGDVTLAIDGNAMTLTGHWPAEPESAALLARHVERAQGAFARTLRFAFEIDAARVQARLERGVLEIVVPALPRPSPVRIRVLPEARHN